MPAPAEVKTLRVAPGVPVIHLIRTAYDTEGRAVEVCDTVMAGDAYVLSLHRLEAEGLLVSEQRVVDGRTRRVYKATKAGKQALDEDRKALAELAREVLGDKAP